MKSGAALSAASRASRRSVSDIIGLMKVMSGSRKKSGRKNE